MEPTDNDDALVEQVVHAINKADDLLPTFDPDFYAYARAAIAVLRPAIRAEALREAVQCLASLEYTINAVQFRHCASAVLALIEKETT